MKGLSACDCCTLLWGPERIHRLPPTPSRRGRAPSWAGRV